MTPNMRFTRPPTLATAAQSARKRLVSLKAYVVVVS